jgi:hypothetical protein
MMHVKTDLLGSSLPPGHLGMILAALDVALCLLV